MSGGKNDKKCSFKNWQKKTQYNTQYNQEKMIQVNPVKAGELKVKRKKMKTLKDRSVSNLIDAVSLYVSLFIIVYTNVAKQQMCHPTICKWQLS